MMLSEEIQLNKSGSDDQSKYANELYYCAIA
jgi:hypothetical protein